jgi:hypothetical protein
MLLSGMSHVPAPVERGHGRVPAARGAATGAFLRGLVGTEYFAVAFTIVFAIATSVRARR